MTHLQQYVTGVVLGLLVVFLTGCSFKVEFGAHGITGRSDTTDTRFAKVTK